nr:PREDICTED: protein ZGRF1-like [Latimeria chalumnae]|eukprot:XP_014347632.1 PREDICTED: protein ZGRF1-like [Latimeria chalumnae]
MDFFARKNVEHTFDFCHGQDDAPPMGMQLNGPSRCPGWLQSSSTSDSDFELTQWASRESKKELSPAQQVPSLSLEPLYFLRPSSTVHMNSTEGKRSTLSNTPSDNSGCNLGIKEMTNLENNRRIRPRKPVITLPSADEPSELTAVSEGNPSDQVEQWSPVPSLSLPACQIGPQDMEIKRHFSKETTEGSRQEPTRPSVSNLSIQSSESKWLKYQNTPLANLAAQNTTSVLEVDDFYAGNVFGKLGEERREPVMQKSAATSQSVQMIQERLVDQHGTFKRQDNVTGIQATSSEFRQPCTAYKAQNSLTKSSFCAVTGDTQNISVSELSFPSSSSLVRCASIPKRQVCIPASFISPGHYKQVFTAALTARSRK